MLEIAKHLVATESVSDMSNGPIAELISQLCHDAGCNVSRFAYDNDRQFNIVATKGGCDPYLALSGHTDTVAYRRSKWSTDPMGLVHRNGKFYGLGIADMKLAIATVIAATASTSTRELKRPLGLYFTAQEEIGCIGAKQLVSADIQIAPYVIVCEPTEMAVANRHKGYVYFSVTVKRNHDRHDLKSRLHTHSSDDRGCTNAIEALLPLVLRELGTIKGRLRAILDSSFDPPYTTVNVGEVKQAAEASKNIIPTEFTLHCDARPIPELDHVLLLRLIERQVKNVVTGFRSPIRGETFSVEVKAQRRPTPALLTPVESAVFNALGECEPIAMPYNTEAGLYNAAGSQSAVFGPGSISDAHHEDECVSERWLQGDVAERYRAVIRTMCG